MKNIALIALALAGIICPWGSTHPAGRDRVLDLREGFIADARKSKKPIIWEITFREGDNAIDMTVALEDRWEKGVMKLSTYPAPLPLRSTDVGAGRRDYACSLSAAMNDNVLAVFRDILETIDSAGVDRQPGKIIGGHWLQSYEGHGFSFFVRGDGYKQVFVPFDSHIAQLKQEMPRYEKSVWQHDLDALYPTVKERLLPVLNREEFRIGRSSDQPRTQCKV